MDKVKLSKEQIQKYSDSFEQLIQQGLEKRKKAEEQIKTTKVKIEQAEKLGFDISKASALLQKAQKKLSGAQEIKEYDYAKKLANRSIQMLNKRKKNYLKIAKESITAAENATPEHKPEPEPEPELEPEPGPTPKPEPVLELEPAQVVTTQEVTEEKNPILKLMYPGIKTFKSDTWFKLELEISNEGNGYANEIKLKISEDVESRGVKTINKLMPGEKKTIGIGIRTHEIGEIPINVEISYINPITNDPLELQDEVWINTEHSEVEAKIAPEKTVPETIKKPEVEGTVNVLSEVEVFQGFVRLKVGIRNEMNTVVTDAKFDLEFDNNAMRLDRIEPDFDRKGNKIILGVIHPQEKRTIAFYLDPLICTESHIDGTLTYKDIYGELKNNAMKRRKAEVVCPILYTPANINTAMLKQLINEELRIHDSKIYEIPPGLNYERAMSICKDIIQGYDLKFVREFVEYDLDDPEIESWYYGTTKVKKYKVVIKASTRKKTNTIELFVACKDKQVITGFLAELGHIFNDKLKELGITKQPALPVTDNETREEISQTSTLLQHQYSDKTTLSISKRGDEYEVSFKTSEERGEASELCEFIKVSPDSRLDVISQINDIVTLLNIFACTRGGVGDNNVEKVELGAGEPGKEFAIEDKIKDLSSLGQLLYGMFLPVSIQKHLESINEPIILKTNDNEIPWELLHDDKDFLCLKVPIGRKLRSREIPRSNRVTSSDRIRFLFIANATGDLEGAEEEVDYIIKHLSSDIDVDVLKRHEASNASILSAFRSGNYDIIHFAGHAEFNMASPDESALIGSNMRKIYAQEIKRVLGGKPFVFLNACSSGKEKMCENGESYTGSDTEGLASSFILGGALAFIGSSWPLPDISAGILASDFYNHVLSGTSIGEALHKARLHLKTTRPNDFNWMAFTLYGDPTLTLTRRVVA